MASVMAAPTQRTTPEVPRAEARIRVIPLVIWFLILVPAGTSAELTKTLTPSLFGTTVHLGDFVFLAWLLFTLVAAVTAHDGVGLLAPVHRAATVLIVWASTMGVLGFLAGHGVVGVLRDYRGFFYYTAAAAALFEIRSPAYALRLLYHTLGAIVTYALLICVLSLLPANLPLIRETIVYWYDNRRLHFHNTFYLPVGVTAVSALLMFGRGYARLWALPAVGILSTALVLSQTRSAVLVAGGSVLLLLVWTVATRRSALRLSEIAVILTAVAGGTALMTVLINLRAQFGGRLAELLQSPTAVGTFLDRFATFATALNLWGEHPITGWGLGKLVEIPWAIVNYKPWLAGVGQSGSLPGVDNSVLTAGFKIGAIGVFLVLLTWWFLWRTAMAAARRWLRRRPTNTDSLLIASFALSVPGYVITGLTQNVLVAYRNIVVWMILATAFVVLSRSRVRPSG